MSILVDYNQIALGALMVSLKRGEELNDNLVRHIVLNNIRYYRERFSDKYGDEFVIACDNKQYWRRTYFPYYKASRKKDRESSGHDWDTIFSILNNIRDELKEYFPYKTLDVEGAEADDIIATLVFADPQNKHLIISSDKDFIQLHVYNVDQYSPLTKKFVKHDDPVQYLQEHILKGDRSDGIPNVLSQDDTFITDKRQKPLRKTIISTVMEEMDNPLFNADELYTLTKCPVDTWKRNWNRNSTLIDLRKCPPDIKNQIEWSYSKYKTVDKSKLFNYFIEKKLNGLIENISSF
tara:strand:- start:171 stop:1049 length:879 start_codon:yes stop_codon:yes gene_type:complete